MAVKQLPKISDLPEPPDRLVGDQERFDVLTFNSLKAQKKMVNEDLNKTLIPALNQFAVDVNASVDAAKASETLALASKNAAASSAATATTKAGEAAASATAAKASETSALASKNAAGISAATASNAQKAAEAARDEAQDLANVGYASESRAGLAKVDGKTTQAAADGAITVKDVAIGGDLGDLASARSLTAKFIKGLGSVDFNTIAENMIASVYQAGTTNGPGFSSVLLSFFSSAVMGVQAAFISNSSTIVRASLRSKSANGYSPWSDFLMSGRVGDGIEVNNGIPSVPEMQGATASAAGTSGLVPPAAAGQHESFLTGGGEYKPALTKISDSVNLADSKTAASAKAVKAAYERGTAGVTAANGKLSLSGGVMSGRIGGLRGNYNADASSRYATGALEIRENGGVGNAQSDIAYAPTIGFHWANKVAGLLALRSDGIFTFLKQNGTRAVVDCDVPYATAANKLRREGGVDTSWYWSGQGGQPGWLWGGNDGVNMYVYNPANFSVNYANSCNYANGAEYANNAGSVVGTPNINVNNNGFNTLPPGGTWRLIQSDGSGFLQIKGEYAGGTYVGYSKFMYIRIA